MRFSELFVLSRKGVKSEKNCQKTVKNDSRKNKYHAKEKVSCLRPDMYEVEKRLCKWNGLNYSF